MQSEKDGRIYLPAGRLPLIRSCEHCRSEDGFVHPDRVLDYNVIVYVENGSISVCSEGRQIKCGAGSFFLLKAGGHHWGVEKNPPGTEWYFAHFYLPRSSCGHSFREFDDMQYKPECEAEDYDFYYPLPESLAFKQGSSPAEKMKKLYERFQMRNVMDRLSIGVQLYEVLLDLFSENEERKTADSDKERTAAMLRHLESRSRQPFSSEEIEKTMGLSYKHLNEIFKKATGTTLQKYHARVRMEEGARMLRRSSLSVSQISELLGFCEPFYFSNAFKKHMGMSPAAYRKAKSWM